MRAKIRLCVDAELGAGQSVSVTRDQAHYLSAVMRQGPGDAVAVFNGRQGEWTARVIEVGKRGGRLECEAQALPQVDPADVWLLFAPIKKARTDFIVEKAAEMGVRRIVPVITRHTNAGRVRRDRLQAHATEAAEQCGGVFVPPVAEAMPLDAVLDAWPTGRRILFCDETLAGGKVALHTQAPDLDPGPWAVLIGPEGGFSDDERSRIAALPGALSTALGPRVLRADTAAVAALTLWHRALGDWR
ncbi:MAG: 16S rRNA (uracil(1498)-N(3))-methyltransferase [Pseudomonadota bacterium]